MLLPFLSRRNSSRKVRNLILGPEVVAAAGEVGEEPSPHQFSTTWAGRIRAWGEDVDC